MVPNVLQAHAFDIEKLNAFTGLYNELMLADSGLAIGRPNIGRAVGDELPGRRPRRETKSDVGFYCSYYSVQLHDRRGTPAGTARCWI